jgi:hypothetical protein
MTQPERVGIKMGDGIGRNFFDHRPDRRFIPDVVCKRAVTTEGNHA